MSNIGASVLTILFFFICSVTHAETLDLATAESVLEDALLLPMPIREFLPLNTNSESQKQIIASLYEIKAIKSSPPQVEAEFKPYIDIVRDYPSYKVTGLQIRLCSKELKIEKIALASQNRRKISGEIIAKATKLSEVSALRDIVEKQCKTQKHEWIVSRKDKKWILLNK